MWALNAHKTQAMPVYSRPIDNKYCLWLPPLDLRVEILPDRSKLSAEDTWRQIYKAAKVTFNKESVTVL